MWDRRGYIYEGELPGFGGICAGSRCPPGCAEILTCAPQKHLDRNINHHETFWSVHKGGDIYALLTVLMIQLSRKPAAAPVCN